ncbi:DUF5776 domain-containing protein [Apilactobacillus quenuiae]|uniref:DUF5776 domain-containing protein n=1 Tax=Apilactobacillus quenuiae TaxID=2008377 RepID=UPI000D01C5D2|nr:DUF5776 domain-containing protein [Apilactobacillus quenuiae]
MQYNKNQFNKVNDKKVMRKVKKQWVVASVATLAVLGGFAVSGTLSMNQPTSEVVAHAAPNSGDPADNTPSSDATNSVDKAQTSIDNDKTSATNNKQNVDTIKSGSNFSNASNQQINEDSAVASNGVNTISDQSNAVSGYIANRSNAGRNGLNTSAEGTNATQAQATAHSAKQDTDHASSDASIQNSAADIANSASADNNDIQNSKESATSNFNKIKDDYTAASNANDRNQALGSNGSSGVTDIYNSIKDDYNNASADYNGTVSSSSISSNAASADSDNTNIQNNRNNISDKNNYGTATTNNISKKADFDSDQLRLEQDSYNNLNSLKTSIDDAANEISQKYKDAETQSGKLTNLLNDPKYQANNGAYDAWSQIQSAQSNGSNASFVPSMSGTNNTSAYSDGFNGVAHAWESYNSFNSKAGTQGVQDYTDHNSNDPSSVDSFFNSGKSSIQKNGDVKVIIPQDPNATKQNESESIVDGNQTTEYNQGITYFLAHQGTVDAESGRWTGKFGNSSYTPTNDSQNAYDQAYRGAQDAIGQQFDGNNMLKTNPSSFNPSTSNQDSNYLSGFKDVIKQVQSGTAFISNPTQMNNVIAYGYDSQIPDSSGQSYKSAGGTINSNNIIKNIKILNDLDFSKTNTSGNGGYTYINPEVSNFKLTYDGQNHIIDMGGLTISVNQGNSSMPNLTVKNFATIYGNDYWGSFKIQTYGNLKYSNLTYIGAEMSNATKANVSVENNLNIFTVNGYKTPFSTANSIQGSNNNQENLEVGTLTMENGSRYYGSTVDGNNLEIGMDTTGNVELKNNSHMKLLPQYNGNSAEHNTYPTGIYLNTGSLSIDPGAEIDIVPTQSGSSGLATGLDIESGSVNINGGILNIDDNGYLNHDANTIKGTLNVRDNGLLKIYGHNLSGFSNALLSSNGLNITNRGNLDLSTDGTGSNPTLLNNSSSFNIDNPGNNVTLQINKQSNGQLGQGKLFSNPITAYSVNYIKNDTGDTPRNSDKYNGPYYEVVVPTGSSSGNSIQYIDPTTGKLVNDDSSKITTSTRYLSFTATPNVFFRDKISVPQNDQGKYDLNGALSLSNVPHDAKGQVYINVNVNGSPQSNDFGKNGTLSLYDSNGNFIKNLTHSNDTSIKQVQGLNKYGTNTYTDAINLEDNGIDSGNANGDIIKFSYPLTDKPSSVTVLANYSVTSQKQSINGDGTNNFTNALSNPIRPSDDVIGTDSVKLTQPFTPTVQSAQAAGSSDGNTAFEKSNIENHTNGSKWTTTYSSVQQPDIQNSYINSYNSGYEQAQAKFKNSLKTNGNDGSDYGNAYVDGANSQNKPASGDTQQEGYSVAQQAKKDAVNATSGANYNSSSDVSLPAGYNAGTPKALTYQSAYYGAYEAKQNATNNNQLSNPDKVSQAAYDTQRGASDFLNGQENGSHSSGASDSSLYNNGYGDAQKGYSDAINASSDKKLINDDSNYNVEGQQGIAAANSAYDGYHGAENNGNPQNGNYPSGSSYSKDSEAAYNGVADAIAKVKKGDDSKPSGSGAYINAYNNAKANANKANNAGNNDFLQGKPSKPDDVTPSLSNAEKSVYTNAYSNTQKGYQEGLQSSPNKTAEPSDHNEKSGYDEAGKVAKGYQDAINDFYNNGVKTLPGSNTHKDEQGYQDTIRGLIDGSTSDQSTTNKPSPNNSPLYDIARAQSMGSKHGISDAKKSPSVNSSDVPEGSNVDPQYYKTAYDAAQKGYNGTSNYESGQNNNPIYTNSFDQGAQQKGADDFLNNNDTNPDNSTDYGRNYRKGHTDAQRAYENPDNKNDESEASNTGANAAKSKDSGYKDAQDSNIHGPKDPTNPDYVNAYWGAKAGANTGDTPSTSVNTNSLAYKDANKEAQKDAANGAQQYLNDKLNNKTPLQPSGSDVLYNQGYNNQKAYDDGYNNPNTQKTLSTNGENDAYAAGQNANKNGNGYQAAQQNKDGDGSQEFNGAKQGFADAKSGSQFNPSNKMPSNLDDKGQIAYQSSYAKAYAEASAQMNKGAQQYTADKNGNASTNGKTVDPNSNEDAQSFNQGYNNQKAYDSGLNSSGSNQNVYPNGTKNPYPDGSPEAKAYDKGLAAKSNKTSAQQDAAGNGAQNTEKPDSYNGALAGYEDGANGNPSDSNIGKSSEYQNAYNNAFGDMQKSRAAGAKDFFDQVNGDNLDNVNQVNPARSKTQGDTSIEGKAQNNAFAEQQGYAAGIANDTENKNPYQQDPDRSTYNKGFNEAKAAKQGYEAAQKSTDPTKQTADQVTNPSLNDDKEKVGYTAAAKAYQDVKDGKQTDNSNQSPEYQMAYNMAYNVDKSAANNGSQSLLNNPNATSDNPYNDKPEKSAEKSLYDQGFNDSKDGYNSVMDKSKASSNPNTQSDAYNKGAQLANNLLNGIKSAAKGDKSAPSTDKDITNGFNVANEAIKNAVNDSKSNKNQGTDGKLDPSKISVPNDVPTSATQAYIDVYKGAYNGYNAGLNGGSQTPDASKDADYVNNPAYQAAYDNTFKQGQNDIPAPSSNNNDNGAAAAGSLDFLDNNLPKKNFDDQDQQNAYQNAYADTDRGFKAAVANMNPNANGSKYYNNGYDAGKQGLAGINDAKDKSQANPNGNAAYKNGYTGYQAGIDAAKRSAKDSKNSKNDLVDKGIVYSYAYKQAVKTENRRQNNLGAKAGYEMARKSHIYPTNLSSKHSQAYINAYTKAYRKELARRMPRYIYNLKGMFRHSNAKFTRASRIKGYKKTPRYASHVFKVEGITYSKTGLPRYIVRGGGMVTASGDYVANAYYQRNETKPNQRIRVIKPQGTFIYNSKHFNKKTAVKKLNKNKTIRVKRVENIGSITRFYIGDGKYISSNKTIVETVR